MSPNHPKSTPESQGQGQLFGVNEISSGVTDPALQSTRIEIVDVGPDGVYQEVDDTNSEQAQENQPAPVVEAIRKAVQTQNRHKGNLGKHSALERSGSYADLETGKSNIQIGDFLPGFGPVTYRNAEAAHKHALKLEKDRQQKRR